MVIFHSYVKLPEGKRLWFAILGDESRDAHESWIYEFYLQNTPN